MNIRQSTPLDLPQIRYLLQESSRSFLNGGLEDLPDLLTQGISAVGEADGRLWGFVGFHIEERPSTLPTAAAQRVFLRAAAMQSTLFATRPMERVVGQALAPLLAADTAVQIIALTQQPWLKSFLKKSGFTEVDQVRFYVHTRADHPPAPDKACLRSLRTSDLARVAQLDSESFPALWHMDRSLLMELCFHSRLQVAELNQRLVGYTALTIESEPGTGGGEKNAFLVRIAVHPSVQGQGIGRQLLADALSHAHAQRAHTVQLNTQESNRVSQALYESVGFRRQGRNISVLVRNLEAQQP